MAKKTGDSALEICTDQRRRGGKYRQCWLKGLVRADDEVKEGAACDALTARQRPGFPSGMVTTSPRSRLRGCSFQVGERFCEFGDILPIAGEDPKEIAGFGKDAAADDGRP